MFSIIKKIQELFSRLKRNKGLFFTSISILSISGIAVFIYLIMTMTSSIKKEVHESISNNYSKSINNLLNNNKQNYELLANTIISDQNIVKAIKSNNTDLLNYYENIYNNLYKKDKKFPIDIKFYPILETKIKTREIISQLLRTKSGTYGIEAINNGIKIIYVKAIVSQGNFIGLLELKQSIHSLKEYYNKKDAYFMFIMDKKMLVKLSLKYKSGNFNNLVSNYIVKKSIYSSRFYSKISEISEKDFTKSLKKHYDSDDKYFRSYKVVTDINGVEIGLFIFGENIEKNNSFIALADRMVKSVTYVSLGLVISILLFMF